jgi:hypothetical protein
MYSDNNTPSEIMFRFVLENLKHLNNNEDRMLVCQACSYLISDGRLSKLVKEVGIAVTTMGDEISRSKDILTQVRREAGAL